MHLVPVAPPQSVPAPGRFDYVTVDAARRRVYAAHTGARALLIVDAETGKPLGAVRVGPMHGVAVDPATGAVFTGDGTARTVAKVDPVALRVVATVHVAGPVDAIAYDAALGRIYADEDNGTRIFVIDAKTMREIGTVTLPGHDPEYLAVDPRSHDVYQNISDRNEFVVVDPHTLRVDRTIPTPEITANHPLQYDPGLGEVIVAGGGTLAVYDRGGHQRYHLAVPKRIDQCNLDAGPHMLACAGGGTLTIVALAKNRPPHIAAEIPTPRGVHTVAIDSRTRNVWIVWGSAGNAFVQRYALKP